MATRFVTCSSHLYMGALNVAQETQKKMKELSKMRMCCIIYDFSQLFAFTLIRFLQNTNANAY